MHEIKRFTRARREKLTNWDKPHRRRYVLVCVGIDGTETALAVFGRRDKRRYNKICDRLNGKF